MMRWCVVVCRGGGRGGAAGHVLGAGQAVGAVVVSGSPVCFMPLIRTALPAALSVAARVSRDVS